MCAQSNSNIHALARLRTLRLDGHLAPALKEASEAVAAFPADGPILLEAIRVLILAQQTDAAAQLYQTLPPNKQQNNDLNPEALVRLALQLNRQDLLEGMPIPTHPAWLAHLLATGEDPVGDFVLLEMQVTVANGPSVYFFTAECLHCGHHTTLQAPTSLLVHRESLCPACFGRGVLDYLVIRRFLKDRFADLLARDVRETDGDLVDHLRTRLADPQELPPVVQALGQEYQFLLNEIVAERLLKDSSARPPEAES